VQERLVHMGLDVTLSEEAKDWLIDKGFNPDFGARPLRRALEQYVEDPLAEEVLRGAYQGKKALTILVREGHLYFDAVDVPEPSEPQKESEAESGSKTSARKKK